MEKEDLNRQVQAYMQSDEISFIESLKFRNTVYQPGDNIELMAPKRQQGLNNVPQQNLHAMIVDIASVPCPELPFPLLKVVWYYSPSDPLLSQLNAKHLCPRQLVLSAYQDWVYLQSLKGKISVLEWQAMRQMDKSQRNQHYFCRSYIQDNQLVTEETDVCFCMTPDSTMPLEYCAVCFRPFHSGCAKEEGSTLPICFMDSSQQQ